MHTRLLEHWNTGIFNHSLVHEKDLTGKYRLKISATKKPFAASLLTFLSEWERSNDCTHLNTSLLSAGVSGGLSYPNSVASSSLSLAAFPEGLRTVLPKDPDL